MLFLFILAMLHIHIPFEVKFEFHREPVVSGVAGFSGIGIGQIWLTSLNESRKSSSTAETHAREVRRSEFASARSTRSGVKRVK